MKNANAYEVKHAQARGLKQGMKRVRTLLLLIGLALFVHLIFQLGAGQILLMLSRVGWNFFLVAVIYGAYQLVRAAALSKCLLRTEVCSYWDILRMRVAGEAVQFLTFTGPFLAEPAKAWLLKERGLTTSEAFAATITEYLTYTFTSAALSIVGLIYLLTHFELSQPMSAAALLITCSMALFLAVSAIAIWRRIYLIGNIISGIARLPLVRRYLHVEMEGVRRMEDLLLMVFRGRPAQFGAIAALEVAAQAVLMFELYWILRTMQLSFPIVYPFLIESATKFIKIMFFFIPMQLGAAEGTYAVLFEALGLFGAAGFTLSLVRRLRSLLVAAVGLIFVVWLTGGPRLDRP